MPEGNRNIILLVLGVVIALIFVKQTEIFSVQDFEEKFGEIGPLIEITEDNPLFDISKVVGGRVTFSVPQCYPEDVEPPITSVLINGRIIASGSPESTCEALVFRGESADLSKFTSLTQIFEIDPSFLTPQINVQGADSIVYFMRVECASNNDCVDQIRRTSFSCDAVDFTCKLPENVEVPVTSSSVKVQEDSKGFSFIPIILIILALVGGFFLLRKK